MKQKNIKKELIKFKTTRNHPEEIQGCMGYIKDYFKNSDLVIKEFVNIYDKRSLYISYTDTKKIKLLLNGHIDVVLSDEEQYFPYIKNNNIHGRGAVDMKADITEGAIVEWAKAQMAAYKYPRIVHLREALPMTATGKILKRP
jgi:acetylornithine deacetylase/succinyl-diaminopimelate desuccinylase-like protein